MGDAAGQNMVTKATYESCLWIQEHCPLKARHFYLESNMATDKKPSFINSLQGRGKSVTAEVLLKKEVLEREMRVSGEQLNAHQGVAGSGRREHEKQQDQRELHRQNTQAGLDDQPENDE